MIPPELIGLIAERKQFFRPHPLFFELGFVGEGYPLVRFFAGPSEIDDGALKQIYYLVKSL